MKRALLSVSDKNNLIPFAKSLVELAYELYATGNTYERLFDHDIPVNRVETLTNFPEMMDGRIKTLHPMIHGGILGKRDDIRHVSDAQLHKIEWIDMVVVNLYPFKETMLDPNKTTKEIIEQIDIGGPALIRSAAKNHAFVDVITDPNDYDLIIKTLKLNDTLPLALKESLAAKAFRLTAQYDAYIAKYFTKEPYPEKLTLTFDKKEDLRYGENPHQSAALYEDALSLHPTLLHAPQLHGKALSYNNILDASSAINILKSFEEPTAVVVKHMNPCGVGSGDDINEAYDKAYKADPVSIFGGIVALNREINQTLAKKLHELFLEIIIAPSYEDEALTILKQKKNVRIIRIEMDHQENLYDMHSIDGGLLIQSKDTVLYDKLLVVTNQKPSDDDLKQLIFGFKVCKFVKSNAIVIVKDYMTLGIGAGQMNRIGAAEIALKEAGLKAQDAYLASDAFFPMKDTVELAIKNGIKAIIQPGGSIKDQESIDLCNQHGIIMVMTQMRHFKHT
jgi:phosphoribosylaminoimidazolecarboxamide formyltransferase / IMP cyclohydrolase